MIKIYYFNTNYIILLLNFITMEKPTRLAFDLGGVIIERGAL